MSAWNSNRPVWGVTVIIPTYNGRGRIGSVLDALGASETPGVPWEVIVVDNASTDGLAEWIQASKKRYVWPDLRVVYEGKPGLTAAVAAGMAEARYGVIAKLDDDNLPPPDWVKSVAQFMSENPAAGIAGGGTEPHFETAPDDWMIPLFPKLAVGLGAAEQRQEKTVWGAGMVIRKELYEQLHACGFQPLLSGRSGAALSSGEDSELCYAARLAGAEVWHVPALAVKHCIPATRLSQDYFARLMDGFGRADPVLEVYRIELGDSKRSQFPFFAQVVHSLTGMVRFGLIALKCRCLGRGDEARFFEMHFIFWWRRLMTELSMPLFLRRARIRVAELKSRLVRPCCPNTTSL